MGKLLSKHVGPSIFDWNLNTFDHSKLSNDNLVEDKQNCHCEWHSYPSRLTTDVVIKVGDQTFHATKDVLSYFSPVLKDFLESSDTTTITLKNISPDIMEIVLTYMYTSDLKINCTNIVEVYRSSQKLRIKQIMTKCIEMMKPETPKSGIYRYIVASQLCLNKAQFKYYKIILKNLEKHISNNELQDLNAVQMCEVLTGAGMPCMKANIKNYYSLFLLASKWVDFNRSQRLEHAVAVMSCIPFYQMSKDELIQCLFSPSFTHVVEIPGVKRLILSTISKLSVNEGASQ